MPNAASAQLSAELKNPVQGKVPDVGAPLGPSMVPAGGTSVGPRLRRTLGAQGLPGPREELRDPGMRVRGHAVDHGSEVLEGFTRAEHWIESRSDAYST
jgi:hypothetical protein